VTTSIEVSGGVGGVAATYQDLRAFAGGLRGYGVDLLDQSKDVGLEALDPALAAAELVCPDLSPATVASIVAAATSPVGGLASQGAALAVVGTLIEASVTTYEAVDSAGKQIMDKLQSLGGMGVGVLTGIGVTSLGISAAAFLSTPLGMAVAAGIYLNRDKLGPLVSGALNQLQEKLYQNPWVTEAMTRGLPGFAQGFSFGLGGGIGGFLANRLSGGRWPTTDYQQSVAGVIAIGQHFGAFQDSGNFSVAGEPTDTRKLTLNSDSAVTTLLKAQNGLYTKGADGGQDGVNIITVMHDGKPSYIVQISGTVDWSPQRSGNVFDTTSNLNLMAGHDTKLQAAVVEAIREHCKDGPVMLTGHSQGGIAAAAISSDPQLVKDLHIKSVLTAGSPVGRFDIDPSVSVLSVEQEQDAVPKLDGVDNPDRPNWTTVKHSLSSNLPNDLNTAHSLDNYITTGTSIDQSHDASIQGWRDASSEFFAGDAGEASISSYRVNRN
jgi:hypothetical protein